MQVRVGRAITRYRLALDLGPVMNHRENLAKSGGGRVRIGSNGERRGCRNLHRWLREESKAFKFCNIAPGDRTTKVCNIWSLTSQRDAFVCGR